MTDDEKAGPAPESPDEPLSGDALGAQELLRAMPRVVADPAFRAYLASQFTSGAIDRPDDAADEPLDVPIEEAAPVHRPFPARRRRAPRWAPFALGAAALLVAGTFGLVLNPGPRWRVASTQRAHGNVLIEDEPIPADDAASVNDALLAGATIEWNGDGNLELVSPGQVALAVLPGTRLTLPAPPAHWFGRSGTSRVDHGEIRLTSGPGFHGARYEISTPEAEVTMTGTTLAVIQEPAGTCVCVLEGRVRVMAGGHDMGMVPGGQRQTVFADGRPSERADMRPVEREKLGEMRAAMAPMLK